MRVVTFKISKQMINDIEFISREKGMTKSDAIRKILKIDLMKKRREKNLRNY